MADTEDFKADDAAEGGEDNATQEAWDQLFKGEGGEDDAKPEPEADAKGKTGPGDEDDEPEDEEQEVTARDALQGIEESLREILGSGVKAKREGGDDRPEKEIEDEILEESPAVQRLAGEVKRLTDRMEQREAAEREERISRLEQEYIAEKQSAIETFGFSKKESGAIEAWMLENPDAARILSFEEVARRLVGHDALEARRARPSPGKGARPTGTGKAPARIVSDTGGPSNPPRPMDVPEGARMSDISRAVLKRHFNIG